jgi:hypothetical protein
MRSQLPHALASGRAMHAAARPARGCLPAACGSARSRPLSLFANRGRRCSAAAVRISRPQLTANLTVSGQQQLLSSHASVNAAAWLPAPLSQARGVSCCQDNGPYEGSATAAKRCGCRQPTPPTETAAPSLASASYRARVRHRGEDSTFAQSPASLTRISWV